MYKPTIGLEIHIQLKTKSKMFCGCDNDAQNKPANSVVCPICLGLPGTLPVPNGQVIEWAIKLGKFLGGKINPVSKFDRKHYFYPDLPKGYQISQYDLPLVTGGSLGVDNRAIALRRIHLEEDAGKLLHPKGKNYSLVDLNRAGTPLLEVVTEPQITSPREARRLAEILQVVLRYLEISEADMEKGEMRVEANVSLAPFDEKNKTGKATPLGTKVEIKNLNSFRAVENALNFEIQRQSKILQKGSKITQATFGFDENKGVTFLQRSKEEAQDYRYFPEPDIPAMVGLDKLKVVLPEDFSAKSHRLIKLGIAEKDIEIIFGQAKLIKKTDELLASDEGLVNFIKEAVRLLINFEAARQLNGHQLLQIGQGLRENKINPAKVVALLKIILEKRVSVKDALSGKDFSPLGEKALLDNIVSEVIDANPKPVLDYKKGKSQALDFLLGKVMAKTKGQAVAGLAIEILKKKINE